MSPRIDLAWIGDGPAPAWRLGSAVRAGATPVELERVMRQLADGSADACLFWAERLGRPDPARIEEAFARPGDVWHAGLRLGMASQPSSIDFVAPTWMLNRDPDPEIEATSWRLSLEACLVRRDVLRRLGVVRPEFETLAGAGLEMGHRWIRAGALMRHLPWLVPAAPESAAAPVPLEDGLRFVSHRFGRFWLRWSAMRAMLTGDAGVGRILAACRRLRREAVPPAPSPLRETAPASGTERIRDSPRVTVLIPTVDRYPYLETLLDQLRRQTVPPLEIVVVDQTPADRRRGGLEARFPDLPLRVFVLDQAGQCSSRNVGIQASAGDHLLLLDDDVEVPPPLIESHLVRLERYRSEVSCGVAVEDGAGPLPADFRLVRASDVFPAGNSMVRMDALEGSGLFDLEFDRGARADADLGTRLYLSGRLLVMDPAIEVLHRHAPRGGLRSHGARVVTYASSRARLTHRHLPSVTELYLAKRYFSPRQVRESQWLRAATTLAGRGGPGRRLLKALVGLVLLPDTLRVLRRREREAARVLSARRPIPQLAARDAGRTKRNSRSAGA